MLLAKTDISPSETSAPFSDSIWFLVDLSSSFILFINNGDQDNILADEQHKQFLYLGVWAPWITILSMEY